jgi:RHS repeat-associated protein
VLESCSSSAKGEIWAAGPNGTWVNPNSGMCLTDPGGSTTTGTQVTITACVPDSGNKDQSWATAAGTAASPLPGSTQGITYYPTGLVDQVKQSSGTRTQTITYVYDADGNLLVAEDPAAITYYGDGGAEELTFTTAGAISSATRFYSQSPDGTIIVRAVTGITTTGSTSNVYYEVTDPQHTAVQAINASTLAASRRSYDPYGNQLTSASTWPDNKAYLDQVKDAPTALDLLGARQYNPVTGAFLSLDPVLESGSPQQMGGYTYAANNPASTSDPSGLSQYVGGGTAPNPCGADASASCNPNGTGGVNGGDNAGGDPLCGLACGLTSSPSPGSSPPPPSSCANRPGMCLPLNNQFNYENQDAQESPGNHYTWGICAALTAGIGAICPSLAAANEGESGSSQSPGGGDRSWLAALLAAFGLGGSGEAAAVLGETEAQEIAQARAGAASAAEEAAAEGAAEDTLPKGVGSTFTDSAYSKVTTSEPTTLYRVYGGTAKELGAYWTQTLPESSAEAVNSLALDPAWGNTAENWVSIEVPSGTTFYEGTAAAQGDLPGGGSQVFFTSRVEAEWITGGGSLP